jgi:hypothetical protein
MPATYKLPSQNLELKIPSEGEIFRGPSEDILYQRVGSEVKTFKLPELAGGQKSGEHISETLGRAKEQLKSQFGLEFGQLPTYNIGDVSTAFGRPSPTGGTTFGAGMWPEFKIQPVGQPEVITAPPIAETFKTPSGAIVSPTGVAPVPALGVPPQLPPAGVAKPYFRTQGTNEVFATKDIPELGITTGQHITAEKAATIPNFFQQVEVVAPQKMTDFSKLTTTPFKETIPLSIETIKPSDLNDPLTGGATIASATQVSSSINDTINMLNSLTGATAGKYSALETEISNLLGKTAGRTEALAEEERKAGIDAISNQLKNIQNEINTKTAAFNKLYAEIEAKPITMSSIIGFQAQARKVAEADIMFLQSQVLALQNNLAFAQQIAQNAVNTKYAPIEEELKIKQAQLALLEPSLAREEKKQAQALEVWYDEQKRKYNETKEAEQLLVNVNLDAMAKYPSAGIAINDNDQLRQQKIVNSMEYKASLKELKTTITPTIVSELGEKYATRLEQEVSNLYAGRYGQKGSREKIINVLKSEFPNVDVSKDIYTRVPDGYEKQIKTGGSSGLDFGDL